jgi:hypothetical protein
MMNERIRELAIQSGANVRKFKYQSTISVAFDDESFEKFAELIVRECARVLEAKKLADTPMGVEAFAEDWDVGYNDAMEDAVKCIQEHFGVEE